MKQRYTLLVLFFIAFRPALEAQPAIYACNPNFVYALDFTRTVIFTSVDSNAHARSTWLFGDGTTGSGLRVSHTFPTYGAYNVGHFIYDSTTHCIDSIYQMVTVTSDSVPPPACNASFSFAVNGNSVSFYPADSLVGTINYWHFGDSSRVSMALAPVHVYPGPGTYTVRHIVNDTTTHCTDSVLQQVAVGGAPPGCSVTFSATQDSGTIYTFTASPTNQGRDSTFTYQWTISDSVVSTQPTFTYIFPQPGVYNVCVYQSSPDSSCRAQQCQEITVVKDTTTPPPPPACSVSFSSTADSTYPSTYHFYAFASPGGDSVVYAWTLTNVLDSTAPVYLSGADPVYTFASPGTYRVSLVATEPSGCVASFGQVIQVDSAGSPAKARVTVYPNPVRDEVNVMIKLSAPSPLEVTILSSMGTIVDHAEEEAVAGDNTFTFPVKNLVPGIYFIHLQYGNQHSVVRFQKL